MFSSKSSIFISATVFCIFPQGASLALSCETNDPYMICDSSLISSAPTGSSVKEEGYCLRESICSGFFALPTNPTSMSLASLVVKQSVSNDNFVAISGVVNSEELRLRARASNPYRYGVDVVIGVNESGYFLPISLDDSALNKHNMSIYSMDRVAFNEGNCPLGTDTRVFFPNCIVDSLAGVNCEGLENNPITIKVDPGVEFRNVTYGINNAQDGSVLQSHSSLNKRFYSVNSVSFEIDRKWLSDYGKIIVSIRGEGFSPNESSELKLCVSGE